MKKLLFIKEGVMTFALTMGILILAFIGAFIEAFILHLINIPRIIFIIFSILSMMALCYSWSELISEGLQLKSLLFTKWWWVYLLMNLIGGLIIGGLTAYMIDRFILPC